MWHISTIVKGLDNSSVLLSKSPPSTLNKHERSENLKIWENSTNLGSRKPNFEITLCKHSARWPPISINFSEHACPVWIGGQVAKLIHLHESFWDVIIQVCLRIFCRRGMTFICIRWYFFTKCGKIWLLRVCLFQCLYHRPPLDISAENNIQFQL